MADAVRRARGLRTLRVGLHVVAVEGSSVLGHAALPSITDLGGAFPGDQLGLSLRYLRPRARRELAAEIEAQFVAFAATGLTLDHANAHKHMHLHPVVGDLLIRVGLRHGLGAIRIPAEPPSVLRACGETPRLSDAALYRWTQLLRWRCRRAGLQVNDHCFGIAWSGRMDFRASTAARPAASLRSQRNLLPSRRCANGRDAARHAGISSGGRVGRPA